MQSNSSSMRLSSFQVKDTSANKMLHEQNEPSLQSLHSRLQEEMEKVIRWKVATEVTLNQRERQLNDSQKMIKVLRNNLVEQQLNSEHLSQRLLREKNQREQVEEQVAISRHLCNTLKQHHQELETSVTEFNTIRETLEAIYKDAKEQIKFVTSKFEELSFKHKTVIDDVTSKSNQKVNLLTKERDNLRESFSLKETEVQALKEESEFKHSVVQKCCQAIFILEERVETLSAKNNWASCRLDETKKFFGNIRSELEEKISALKSIVSDLREKLKEENEKLVESRQEFEEAVEKVKYLTRCNTTLEGGKEELLQQLRAIKHQKEDMQKEIQLTSEKLEKLIKVSSENECALKKEKADLENDLKSCRGELRQKTKEHEDIVNEFKQVSEKLEFIEKKYDQDKSDMERRMEEKVHENKTLTEKLSEMNTQLRLKEEEKEREVSNSANLKEEICSLKQSLSISDEATKAVKEEFESLSKKLQEENLSLSDALEKEEKLKSTLDSLSEENKNLRDEIQKEKNAYKDLEKNLNSGKRSLNLELKKNEKLKGKLQTLESSHKVKASKSKDELKNFENIIEELKGKIENLESQNNDLETSVKELKENNKEIEVSLNEQRSAREEAEESAMESATKAQVAQNEANSKIKEMMELSDSWKRENEAVIESKNEEILEIKTRFEKLEESLLRERESQKELQNAKSELEGTVRTQDEEILTLRDKLTQRVNEFSELQTAIKSLSETSIKSNDVGSPLKTPSPSQYLHLCRPPKPPLVSETNSEFSSEVVGSSLSSTESARAIDSGIKESRNISLKEMSDTLMNRKQSILKHSSMRNMLQNTKNVSFLSPISHMPDSDSSDGFVLEIPSDTDDRFESIKRSSQTRQLSIDTKKGIPKANIQPILRRQFTPCPPQQRESSNTRQPAPKKPRYDRSLRTYGSPRQSRKMDAPNKPAGNRREHESFSGNTTGRPFFRKNSLPFESVIEFNEKK